jgi:micrococcal nuclease
MSASHSSTPKQLYYILYIIAFAIIYEFLPFDVSVLQNVNLVNDRKSTKTLDMIDYKVTKVVDGDTVDVEKNNESYRVRLIGINSPESVDPRREVECFGKEASEYMNDLALGEKVNLETDNTQTQYDKYGRLLAYVYLQDGQMLNRKMLADGYAYEYTYDNPYKYQKDFKEVEEFAKLSNRGLWSAQTCNGQK